MSEGDSIPEQEEFKSRLAREAVDKPMEIPVHIKDEVWYQQGKGFVNRKGEKLVGLSGGVLKDPDVVKAVDQIEELRETDQDLDSRF